MKFSGVDINIESQQLTKYSPVIIVVVCGFIHIISYYFQLSWWFAATVMLFVGYVAMNVLSITSDKSEVKVVQLNQSNDSVFDEIDPSELMLVDLEVITLQINELSIKQIESSRVQTEDAVTAIIDRFVHVSDELDSISKEHKLEESESVKRLRVSLSDILVSFQFQDRTSQILHHVSNSLDIFNEEIKSIQELRDKGGQPEYDKEEIINKLTAGFTTAEQRAMVSQPTNAESNNKVEFF